MKEGSEVVTFCHGLKLEAPDGKVRRSIVSDSNFLQGEKEIAHGKGRKKD
jgi:hypothetical protein